MTPNNMQNIIDITEKLSDRLNDSYELMRVMTAEKTNIVVSKLLVELSDQLKRIDMIKNNILNAVKDNMRKKIRDCHSFDIMHKDGTIEIGLLADSKENIKNILNSNGDSISILRDIDEYNNIIYEEKPNISMIDDMYEYTSPTSNKIFISDIPSKDNSKKLIDEYCKSYQDYLDLNSNFIDVNCDDTKNADNVVDTTKTNDIKKVTKKNGKRKNKKSLKTN